MTRSVTPTMMAVTDTLGVGLPDNAYFNRDIQGVPTKSGSTVRHSPFFKQLTGLTPRGARNTVQKETDRLQFDYIELLPKRIKGDALMPNETVIPPLRGIIPTADQGQVYDGTAVDFTAVTNSVASGTFVSH